MQRLILNQDDNNLCVGSLCLLGGKSDAYHFKGVKGVESQNNNVILRFCFCRTLSLNLFMTSLRNNFNG